MKDRLFIVPHTHYEGAVFKTRAEYLDMALPYILYALRCLESDPRYRFVLDQVCYVRPFLERYPEAAARFREMVRQGRLQLTGAMVTMADVNIPSGESFVRHVLYGKRYYREQLGVEVTAGWALDTFGHHPQMPQLLRQAGFESYWFSRGVPGRTVPSEFLWQGIDGSRILALWLPYGYGLFYHSARNLPEFAEFVTSRYELLQPFATTGSIVGLSGADVAEPEPHLPALAEEFNRQHPDAPFEIVVATPDEYLAALREELGTDLPGSAREAAGAEGGGARGGGRRDEGGGSREEGGALIAARSSPLAPRPTLLAPSPRRPVAPSPVVAADLNPLFQGCYSSRIEVKQANRELERLLTTVEKCQAIAATLGLPVDVAAVERAWEPVLFNQAHDLICGVQVDHVFDDSMRSYSFARRLGSEVLDEALAGIVGRIDTAGAGIPLIVFNSLGWARTDLAEVDVGFAGPGAFDVRLVDPEGQPVPVQILEAERYADGALKRARIAFIARDVPPLGYAVYRVISDTTPDLAAAVASPAGALASSRGGRRRLGGDRTSPGLSEDRGFIANEHVRLEFDLWTGALTSLQLSADGWEVIRDGMGNVVAREPDGGDFWQIGGTLRGSITIQSGRDGAPSPQPSPTGRGSTPPLPVGEGSGVRAEPSRWDRVGVRAELSCDQTGDGSTRDGPVIADFVIRHPFGRGYFATTARIYAGLPRIDFRTVILNQDEWVRYRALFATTIPAGRITHEIPFGAVERSGREFPAQNWVDYGDGEHGLALLNRGLPGNNVADGVMMLSLMRSTQIVSYSFHGGYEQGTSSAGGQEKGKQLTFEYALLPHRGDWQEAGVYRAGLEFNNPLIVRKATAHAGDLPRRWGLLRISHPNVVVSAVKPGRDGSLVVRVYEAAGRPVAGAELRLEPGLTAAAVANLLEDAQGELPLADNALRFDLGAFEIKTFTLRI